MIARKIVNAFDLPKVNFILRKYKVKYQRAKHARNQNTMETVRANIVLYVFKSN